MPRLIPLGTIKEEKNEVKTKFIKEEKPDVELAVPDMGQIKQYFSSPQLNQKWGDMVGLSLKSLKDYEKPDKVEKNEKICVPEGLKPFVIGISGGTSTGKRHLVKSMRQTLASKYNINKVTYFSEENFYKTYENMAPLSSTSPYSSSILSSSPLLQPSSTLSSSVSPPSLLEPSLILGKKEEKCDEPKKENVGDKKVEEERCRREEDGRKLEEKKREEGKIMDYDDPANIEWEVFHAALKSVMNRKPFSIPIYCKDQEERKKETMDLEPSDLIIVEGMHVFYDKTIRESCDLKLFLDTDEDVRLSRRVFKDVVVRKKNVSEVIDRYLNFIKPGFEKYVLPSKKYADIIIPNYGGGLFLGRFKKKLDEGKDEEVKKAEEEEGKGKLEDDRRDEDEKKKEEGAVKEVHMGKKKEEEKKEEEDEDGIGFNDFDNVAVNLVVDQVTKNVRWIKESNMKIRSENK